MVHSPSPTSGRRWRVWIEALAALGAAVTLDVLLGRLGVPPDFALPLYVAAPLVVGLRGGFSPALMTAVLCVAADLARLPDGRSASQVMAGAACVLGASLVGLAVERLLGRIRHLEHVVAALREPPEAAITAPDVRPHTDSLPRLLYRYARLLNVTDESALYAGLAITLQEVLPADAVAVFTLTAAGPVQAAGDALRAPDPAALDFGEGRRVIELDPGGARAVALLREGPDGPPAALVVVLGAGRPEREAPALRLLAVFADWGSAVLGHARALATLPSARQAATVQQAEARGREAAKAFARTGRLTLVPRAEGGAQGRDTLRERAAVPFGFEEASGGSNVEDTERVDGPALDELLDSALLEDVSGESGPKAEATSPGAGDFAGPPSLLIGAARASMQIEALEEVRDRRRRRSDRLPPLDGATVIDAGPPLPDAGDPPPEPRAPRPPIAARPSTAQPPMREADAVAPEVRRAIERMARRLAAQPAPRVSGSGDEAIGGEVAAMDHYAMPAFEDETVAPHELPLIAGAAFGVGVAQELGRSVADRRFATLLANLSEHLDGE